MRILFIDFTLPQLAKDADFPVGGWAVELQTWLQGLIDNGNVCGVLTWKGAKDYVGRELSYELIETYDPKKGIKIAKYFYSYIPKMVMAAKEFQPDVVVQACSGLNTGLMAYVASKLKVPFVYRIAGNMDTDEHHKEFLLFYQRIAYYYGLKRTDLVLCQNSYQFEQMKKWHLKASLRIVHNPYDITRTVTKPLPREGRKYIAWLGVFRKEKNMQLLLRVAKELPYIQFQIGGKVSHVTDKKTLETIELLKELPNVEFAGYITRDFVIDFLAKSVALLNTSHHEGFSNTFLESFSSCTPIVAPLRVDPDHIITNNRLGLTTDNDDQLVEKIAAIWEMSEVDYGTLCNNCKSYLVHNHTPVQKAEELERILKDLIS